jgi:hypothetical protein
MPAARTSSRTGLSVSDERTQADSVSSKTIRSGPMPWRATSSARRAAKPRRRSWRGDTFMPIFGARPRVSQSAAWRQTARMTHSPSASMMPVRSASGTKSPG